MTVTTTREPPWMCFLCGYLCDAVSPARRNVHAVPSEGSLALCLNCGHVHVRHGARWLAMTKAERDTLSDDERDELARSERTRASAPMPDLRKNQGSSRA